MTRKEPPVEEAEYEDFDEVQNRKKVVVYGEYDKYRYSPLKKKRIRISIMNIIIGSIIVLILAFVGYRSLQGYGAESRDDIRAGHLALIKEGIDSLVKQGKPLPEAFQKKELISNNTVIGIQGYAGEAFFSAIGKKVLRDPLDNSYYIYYFKPATSTYEVMAFLEGEKKDLDVSFMEKIKNFLAPKIEYRNREPLSIGSIGNILLSNVGEYTNTPINLLIDSNTIDLSNISKYQEYLFLGTSCQQILEQFPENLGKDGNHLLLISGKVTKAYCDMSTDGGGWTLVYANNSHANSPIKQGYVTMREYMKQGIYDLSEYENPTLAGLLDTTHFTTNGAKELLIKNRAGGDGKWVKFTFDKGASLAWALGKDILGRTEEQCHTLPNNGTWSISNNDESIRFEGLTKLMNAGGNSWGVSHTEFTCNNQAEGKSVSPHIAFYSANRQDNAFRARSIEGIGGKWGGDVEYRYFIR